MKHPRLINDASTLLLLLVLNVGLCVGCRQERRLQQFEQERAEQKQRQIKRQEKQEREAEAYLARQRVLTL